MKTELTINGKPFKVLEEIDDFTIRTIEKHGKEYEPALLPYDIKRGEFGNCYYNCFMQRVELGGKYDYVEGFAIAKGFIYLHAWLTDGKYAFDPTYIAFDQGQNEIALRVVYIGVPFERHASSAYILKNKYFGLFANRHRTPKDFLRLVKASRPMWPTNVIPKEDV